MAKKIIKGFIPYSDLTRSRKSVEEEEKVIKDFLESLDDLSEEE